MGLWRRRRKTVLTALATVVACGALALQWWRSREASYTAGEATEGLVDTLARGIPEHHPDVRFEEVSVAAGLEFRHFPGVRTNRLPEDMGSGVALGDLNGDGWVDAFLVNTAGPLGVELTAAQREAGRSRLFLNAGDGTFEDVTSACGIDVAGMGMGAALVDVDSDGDLDVFVTRYGTCRLFINDGAARFHDGSATAGLLEHEGFWTGVAVGDVNRDGAMDVYVCGYVRYDEKAAARRGAPSQYGVVIPAMINPSTFEPERNLLLLGQGDGTFTESAERAGVADERGRGLGAVLCDLNDDGEVDLYVANDVSDNALFLGRGDGTFADATAQALVGDYRGAMGLAAADFDGDLDLDLFITHWVAQENALYRYYEPSGGEDGEPPVPRYMDEADRLGLGAKGLRMVGWGTRFFDYDNDGWLDLFVVNGHTIPEEDDDARMQAQRSHLFWRDPSAGARGYVEVGAVCGDFFREAHVGRGGATFDYDLDGDEDLVVMRHGDRVALLRNDGGEARPSVRVRLRQPAGNRFAIGARVVATTGERRWLEVLGSQGSYLSQHAVGELAFGLGDHAALDRLEVTWPDGKVESVGPFPAFALVEWTRGMRPRVRALPGRRDRDADGPPGVEEQREFFRRRDAAQRARLSGDTAQAVALYRESLVLWPGHADCLYYLGNALLQIGEEDAGLDTFERLVEFEPASSKGWMQIGLLRLPGGDAGLDDLALAKAAFQRCHVLNREESRPALQLGITALLSGELEEAEKLLAGVSRLNPRSVEARWFAGRTAFARGDRERAETLLREARDLALHGVKDASASSEGATRSGRAMEAEGGVPLDESLTRWRTVGEREPDVDREYAQ